MDSSTRKDEGSNLEYRRIGHGPNTLPLRQEKESQQRDPGQNSPSGTGNQPNIYFNTTTKRRANSSSLLPSAVASMLDWEP